MYVYTHVCIYIRMHACMYIRMQIHMCPKTKKRYMGYGEWEDGDLIEHKLYDYQAYNARLPQKRHAHAALAGGAPVA